MKYAVLSGNESFEIKEGELQVKRNPVIRVTHVGVCGTDVTYWKRGDEFKGLVIGHEYAGVIEEPGSTGLFQKGDKVAGYTQNVFNEPCGHCEKCLNDDFEHCVNMKVYTWKGGDLTHPGAYSTLTTWFPKSTLKLPEEIDLESAVFIEPFAVGHHAVMLADLKPNDKVLILGGGIIGLTVSEWVRVYGASEVTVIELNAEKIELIRGYGIASHVVKADDPEIGEKLREISGGGYDVVIDCAGVSSTINIGIDALKKEFYQRYVAVAMPRDLIPVNYYELVFRQTIFRGSKGHSYDEFQTAAKAIASGKINVKKYISKYIPFSGIQQGFKEIKDSNGLIVKAVVEMEK